VVPITVRALRSTSRLNVRLGPIFARFIVDLPVLYVLCAGPLSLSFEGKPLAEYWYGSYDLELLQVIVLMFMVSVYIDTTLECSMR
jgi:hypothetical protein